MTTTNEQTNTTTQTYDLTPYTTVSSQIRYLHSQGLTNSQIAKYLGKRYQHVRNVLTTQLKGGKE